MKVLVTGGAGYIGTHCLVELMQAGIEPVVLDNLSNADPSALARVEQITGQAPIFIEGDIRDHRVLELTFQAHRPQAVLHLAGLKAVGESVEKPLEYYDNNIAGTLQLLHTMREYQCRQIVFSSSATVYGDPQTLPIPESAPIGGTTNPYGTSKYMIERILSDWAHADPQAQVIALRYFNPVGAHPSGLIGEDPKGLPNNLMPFIQKVAVGELEQLSVFGDDYDTIDGTGVRTCTWWTWPRVIWLRSSGCSAKATPALRPSIWAQATASACCKWSMPSSAPAIKPSRIKSRPGGLEISRLVTPMPVAHWINSTGEPSST